MSPSIQEQRDNLSIGFYLANHPYGVSLGQILEVVLGYDPQNSVRPVDYYERRFRSAQRVGRDQYKKRIPGYFTFNAMPFGQIYVYKATWYVWVNPQTGDPQTVPMMAVDLGSMRRLREKDLSTRTATTRGVITAHHIAEQREALQAGDSQRLRFINQQIAEAETLGELLSGVYGLPYAEIQEVIPQLPQQTLGHMRLSFQDIAQRIIQLQRRLRQEQVHFNRQLTSWAMLQAGLPRNAHELALQDAADRLSRLPPEGETT